MADTPETFRSIEPLQQVEQPVSLNRRVERDNEHPDRQNRRPKNTKQTKVEAENEEIMDSAIQTESESGTAETHIDFRA
jgi:hypothetical protein